MLVEKENQTKIIKESEKSARKSQTKSSQEKTFTLDNADT